MSEAWKDRVVVVTGGSAGLGLAIVRAFADRGAKVVAAARDVDRLDAALAPLKAAGKSVVGVVADVSREGDCKWLVDRTRGQWGKIDVLVNNVGRSTRGRAIEVTPEEFQAAWEVNFLTAVNATRAAYESIRETKGSIVNISSLAGKSASRHLGAYPPAKFALAAWSQQLRLELDAEGIHVFLVCPGPIVREDAGERYDIEAANLPPEARQPGGGVKVGSIEPDWLAGQIVDGCEGRWPELVVPWRARFLFAIQQMWPSLGDWLLNRFTSS